MNSATPFTYDAVPYQSFPYSATRPANIYTVGTLFGVSAPNIRTARVLELGCASGGNLIPLAFQYPDGRYTGIDASERQIGMADKSVSDLGLKNIEFIARPFADIPPLDKFDYIICHGVYSWVDQDARKQILEICRTHLVENGLAVISYNALPGWNMVRSLREMMLYQANLFEDPVEKVSQAMELLRFVRDNNPEGSAYRAVIDNEITMLSEQTVAYIAHDHMEAENTPFYFHEFAAALEQHGLQYVGDSNITQMYVDNMPANAAEKLKAVTDILRQEQYMDFITNRRFRSSIVCPSATALNRNLRSELIHDFYLSSSITPDPEDVKVEAADTRFRDPVGTVVFTAHTRDAAVLFSQLSESPRRIKSDVLINRITKNFAGTDREALRGLLEQIGLQLVLKGFISLNTEEGDYVSDISETPAASRLARYQTSQQGWATNARHEKINLDHFTRTLIEYLDGTRSLDDLCQIMVEQVGKGALGVQLDGKEIADTEQRRLVIRQLTETALNNFSRTALLVA
ncbi:MAG: methyltransferase regulatory domain-containing protein [Proteobacteria bacterium]|nr:methyltransferase regulatory domain-containing protein [Pseudomonadota bacterium]MDA1355617.1 methyltransferase regulatory domain-containing protein [Pseudomonadota bacterium]